MTQDPTRAVLYRRVSTDEQTLGLAAQEAALIEESRRRGWAPMLVTDEDVSGSVPAADRPGLGSAIASMERGDVLAVARLDRLSRSVLDFAEILRRAEADGWAIVVLDLGVDMTSPGGRLIAQILVAVAEWERHMISVRIKEGLAQSSKRLGRRPGLPPIGAAARGPAPVAPEVLAAVEDLRENGRSAGAIA
jgi:DNA invertase Pin-like site-specific DNA recombinase